MTLMEEEMGMGAPSWVGRGRVMAPTAGLRPQGAGVVAWVVAVLDVGVMVEKGAGDNRLGNLAFWG